MLKMMRDSFQHLKWILVAIVAVFILFIFVDWGAGGPRSGRSPEDRGYAARVNGQTISMQEFSRTLYFTTKNYEQMYRQPLTPEMVEAMGLNRQVIESLVDQRLLLQEAQRLHLTATADEVQKRILTTPSLNPDGKFIGYDLYQRFVTAQLGYQNVADFEDELSHQITLEKIESALASAVVVSPKAAEAEYRRISENAKIRYVIYPAAREAATIKVTEPEVAAYYKANQTKYAHGEQRAVKYLVADVARIRLTIVPTDADLRKRYDASHEDYRSQEAAHILHILIKVEPNAPPPVDAAAKAKAEDLVKQLRAGADFAKLAKENSGDPSSAGNGGDMGFIERGQTVEPFDTAAFSIQLNTISDPIRTKEYGYHIIKVVARRPAGYRSFEEVRAQLVGQVTDQLAKDHARDQITRIAMTLKENKPKSPEQFVAMANERVSSNDTLWFQKNDTIPGLGNNQVLSTWVFAAKQGDIGEIIGTQRGPAIPYLYGIRSAGISPLDEVKAKVEGDARMARARDLARETLAKAMSEPTIDAIAAKVGLAASETSVTRNGVVAGLQGDVSPVVDAAMTAQVGQTKGPIVVGDAAIAFQVLDLKKVDAADLAKNSGQYMEMLRQQESRSLRAALLRRLRKQSNVDFNTTLLTSKNSASPSGV